MGKGKRAPKGKSGKGESVIFDTNRNLLKKKPRKKRRNGPSY